MRESRAFEPPPGTVRAAWGELSADRKRYAPLETVTLTIGPAKTGARSWRVEWYDGLGRSHGFAEDVFGDGLATVSYPIGGAPGMQFVRLWLDGAERWCRLLNVYLAAETRLETGDCNRDTVYPLSRDSMLLNRRRYPLAAGQVVGYTTADSVQTLAYWLRDMCSATSPATGSGNRISEKKVSGTFSDHFRLGGLDDALSCVRKGS